MGRSPRSKQDCHHEWKMAQAITPLAIAIVTIRALSPNRFSPGLMLTNAGPTNAVIPTTVSPVRPAPSHSWPSRMSNQSAAASAMIAAASAPHAAARRKRGAAASRLIAANRRDRLTLGFLGLRGLS